MLSQLSDNESPHAAVSLYFTQAGDGFLENVFGIALGAFLAFIFGALLNWLGDRKRKSEQIEQRFKDLQNVYLFVWANIDTLMLIKKQSITELSADRKKIEPFIRRPVIQAIPTLGSLQSFFKELDQTEFDIDNELARLEFMYEKYPLFSRTPFHIRLSFNSLYNYSVKRNELIAQSAAQTRDGWTQALFNYYIPMLVSLSEGIEMRVEESLFYLFCLSAQIEKYWKEEFSDKRFFQMFPPNDGYDLIPPKEYINRYVDLLGIDYPQKPESQSA